MVKSLFYVFALFLLILPYNVINAIEANNDDNTDDFVEKAINILRQRLNGVAMKDDGYLSADIKSRKSEKATDDTSEHWMDTIFPKNSVPTDVDKRRYLVTAQRKPCSARDVCMKSKGRRVWQHCECVDGSSCLRVGRSFRCI